MEILSKACITLAPVVTTSYKPKGAFQKVGELNTYVTGNKSSSRGIIHVYDVFGVANQTQQGADRLGESVDAVVLLPDFFKGHAPDAAQMPSDPAERKAFFGKFMAEHGNFEVNAKALVATVAAAQQMWPAVKAWGVFGLCWGGKVVSISSGEGTPFAVSGQAHPGGLAKVDAEKMTIPHICLASHDEAADVVQEYAEVLSGKGGVVETYSTMFHGWMGARANLENEDNAKEFERGYNQVADFFAKHL